MLDASRVTAFRQKMDRIYFTTRGASRFYMGVTVANGSVFSVVGLMNLQTKLQIVLLIVCGGTVVPFWQLSQNEIKVIESHHHY